MQEKSGSIAGKRKGGAKVQPTNWTLIGQINRTNWTSHDDRLTPTTSALVWKASEGPRARQHQDPHFLIQQVVSHESASQQSVTSRQSSVVVIRSVASPVVVISHVVCQPAGLKSADSDFLLPSCRQRLPTQCGCAAEGTSHRREVPLAAPIPQRRPN